MAVTTVDGVIAGGQAHRMFMKYRTAAVSAARWATTWAYAGMPEAGAYDTTLNGVALTLTPPALRREVNSEQVR